MTGGASLLGAQALADICEVDLKTVHHWADRGKIAHHRTEGRHLRFRRNDVVRFLRAHGYPMPAAITKARPVAAIGMGLVPEGSALSLDELAKRVAARFSTRRYAGPVAAIAHLVSDEPDVLVLPMDDPSIATPRVVHALKSDPQTSWIVIATVGGDIEAVHASKGAGADLAVATEDITRLAPELARALAVT